MPRSYSTPAAFTGVPTFFRACCFEATRLGYQHPGYHLMLNLESLVPYTADDDEWDKMRSELRKYIADTNDQAVLQWFCDHYPAFMEHVPKRRRRTFLRGVYEGVVRVWPDLRVDNGREELGK